jgi:uncharacterized protein
VTPNEDLARREAELVEAGDFEGVRDLYADDVELRYPGRSPIGGDFHGKDGVREFWGRLRERLGPEGRVRRELLDVADSEGHAVQLLRLHGERGDRRLTWHAVVVMRIESGLITRVWVHVDDERAVDAFWSD